MLRARHFVWLLLVLALAFCRAHAQTDRYDCYNGSSEQGGNRITVNGIQSNQYVQQSYPGATVTVYLHNTTTLATIWQDAAGTVPLANPFTSSAHSVAFVCAADGRYDFKYSGTTITTPFTVSDIKYCFACSGGGGGAIGPGTVNHVAKFVTTTNVGDSVGFDDGVGLVQWPTGLTSMGSAYGKLYPNSPNGTTDNYLACIDSSVTTVAEVTTCATSTTKAIGIVHVSTAGVTGNAQVTMLGFDSCIFDNQTSVGDYVGPSSTTGGQCSDLGSTRPASIQGVGRVTTLNAGAGTSAIIDLGPWDLFAPGSTGAGQCAFPNANAYFANGAIVCDQFVTDDGIGNMTMKSLGLTDATQAGFYYLKQGALPGATPDNTRMDTLPTSVTAHTVKHPGTAGTAGQAEVVDTTTTDANGHTIDIMKWGTAGGGGVEAQTNGVDNANCVAGVCPLVNLQNGIGTTASNPSGGLWQVDCFGCTRMSTPTAPTCTVNGTPGSTTITYKIVAVEDPYSVYHTPVSTACTVTTANATLSSSNSITLSAYADTLYAARCVDVYRVTTNGSSPTTTGRIAACVGKKFTDTGLAGDSTTAPTTNNTVLAPHMSALPVANIPPNGITGVDAPPASPNALDDEMGENPSVGSPGDVNNTYWAFCNQQSATASYSNGAIIFTTDTSGQIENLCFSLPGSTPYTFLVYLDSEAIAQGAACGIGFRESSTGKITYLEVAQNNTADSSAASGGMLFQVLHATTYSTGLTGVHFWAYRGTATYLKIQNTGTNIVYSYSNGNNGIAYQTLFSEAVTTPFTTAPNQLLIGGRASTTAAVCTFDYERRTQ